MFLVVAVALAGLGVGCSAYYAEAEYVTTVGDAPPVPYDEYAPPPPSPELTWVPGYWWWDGVQWVWVRGRWATPPQARYVDMRSGWVFVDGRYVFVHGRWMPPSRATTVVYVHPAPRMQVHTRTTYRSVTRTTTAPRSTTRRR